MGSLMWPAIVAIVVVSVVTRMIVQIVSISKSGGSKASNDRIEAFEEDIAQLEADLIDARERIEVLEKIVTDEKTNLSRQIDDLANG